MLPPINKNAVNEKDEYLVISKSWHDLSTWRIVESQPTLDKAEKARSILQEHDKKNDRQTIYAIVHKNSLNGG